MAMAHETTVYVYVLGTKAWTAGVLSKPCTKATIGTAS
jgi:hypothetical protein